MKKFFSAIFGVLVFSILNAAQTPTPTPTENDIVKISTTLIQIDVTVTDKNGRIVKDLKSEDFEIYENGVKQEITNFSFIPGVKPQTESSENRKKEIVVLDPPTELKPAQIRRTIALVVDDLSLSFESANFVRRALKKFVDEQMQYGDLVAIIRTGAGIGALQQFTSDKRQLYAAIERVRWNPQGRGRMGAFAPVEPAMREQLKVMGDTETDQEDLEAERNFLQGFNDFQGAVFATGTLGALKYIVGGMTELPGRKSVLLFSDGFQIYSGSENGIQDASRVMDFLQQLVEFANRSSVIFNTIDARGLQTTGLTVQDRILDPGRLLDPKNDRLERALSDRRDELFNTQDGLVFLARETGGISIINQNDISDGVRQILNDQSFYLVGYQPDDETFDPKTRRFNKLEVKVKREGVNVRYRSGFFGVEGEGIAKPTNLTPMQQITNALTSPFLINDVSVRLNALFGSDTKSNFVYSLLHVKAQDLKFTEEPNGNKKTVFDVLAVTYGDNGVQVDQIFKNYVFTFNPNEYKRALKDGFVFYFTFPIKKAGAYQFRAAVRDSRTGKVGSANQFIAVPNLKKEHLILSGIILENLTPQQWKKLIEQTSLISNLINPEEATNPIIDTSLRQFRRGTFLRYGFEIYNAKHASSKKADLHTKVRVFRDGKLILDDPQTELNQFDQTNPRKILWNGGLSLGSQLEPGDYVLQVVLTDNLAKEKQKIASQFVQFEIVP